jgi:DNA-binding NarL/FixJ family response regulator
MAVTSTRTRKQSRIFLVDDHPLMREGLRARIESQPDLAVCGEAADVSEALPLLKELAPQLVIIDLALKSSHGLDLVKEIKTRFSQMKMLVVTAYDENLYAERVLRAGAHGYVNKQEVQDTLIEAIREVLAGRRYLSQTMTQRLLTCAIGEKDPGAGDNPVERLSDRELQVFQLIGEGKATSAIAKQLHLSIHTIDSHRENIRHKLHLADGAQLMQRAVKWVLENS